MCELHLRKADRDDRFDHQIFANAQSRTCIRYIDYKILRYKSQYNHRRTYEKYIHLFIHYANNTINKSL